MRITGAIVAVALVAGAGLVGGCGPLRLGSEGDCPTRKATPVTPALTPGVRAPAETLWTVDAVGTLRAIDATGVRVAATAELGRPDPPLPPWLVAGGGRLWAYRLDAGEVDVVDPATATVARRVTVPAVRPYGDNDLLYAHGALWIAQPGRLWRVTPRGAVTSTVLPAGGRPTQLVATKRWLWLVVPGRLLRIDPGKPAGITDVAAAEGVAAVLPTETGLYSTGVNSPAVRRRDPDTGAVTGTFTLAGDELALSLVASLEHGEVWAVGNCGSLVRLRDRLTVTISDVSQDLPTVAAAGSLWVADEVASQIVRIDAGTGRVLARIPFAAADPDDPSFGLVAGASTVWVLDGDFAGGLSRVDPAGNTVVRVLPAKPGSGLVSAVVQAG